MKLCQNAICSRELAGINKKHNLKITKISSWVTRTSSNSCPFNLCHWALVSCHLFGLPICQCHDQSGQFQAKILGMGRRCHADSEWLPGHLEIGAQKKLRPKGPKELPGSLRQVHDLTKIDETQGLSIFQQQNISRVWIRIEAPVLGSVRPWGLTYIFHVLSMCSTWIFRGTQQGPYLAKSSSGHPFSD